VPEESRLFVYSDGAFEISRADGSMWPFPEFVTALAGGATGVGSPIDALLGRIRELSGQPDFQDDFSMLELVFR
jgi:sigma-B regulation protein RsbU (phosphoserine phosphatase)